MLEFAFDSERALSGHGLFDPEIDRAPWVAFHGTSGVNEENIDHSGLRPGGGAVSRSEIERVTRIFEQLNWCGKTNAGFVVLKPFSLKSDRRDSELPPLFFAESSTRASLYASDDYAGGEAYRSLRYAFEDLEQYARDPSLGGTQEQQERLSRELIQLQNLRARVFEVQRLHSHGVIYAVQMQRDDLQHLQYNSFMGMKCLAPIGADRLIAKVRVPKEWIWKHVQDRRRMARLEEDGLVRSCKLLGEGFGHVGI